MNAINLKEKIRTIPDFPKKGIMFKDITTLLKDKEAFKHTIKEMKKHCNGKIDKVVGAESRGFIFASVLAHELNAGFVPLRKPGKLPHKTLKQEFETEYSTDAFEIHEDAIQKGDKAIIVDDLLATGGTAKAAIDLVEKLEGKVEAILFLIELDFLNGRKKLEGYKIHSLINYDKE